MLEGIQVPLTPSHSMNPPFDETLAELQRVAQLMLWIYWPDTRELWWSEALGQLVGLPAGSPPDWRAFEALLMSEDRGVLARAQQTLAAGALRHEEILELERANPARRWLVFEAFHSAQGALMGTLKDGSERHWVAEKLGEQRQLKELALTSARAGVWSWAMNEDDPDSWCSPQFCRLLGFEPHEISFSRRLFYDSLHPQDQSIMQAALAAHRSSQKQLAVEVRLRTKDGSYKWFALNGQSLGHPESEAQKMVGTLASIHERKQAQLGFERRHHYQEQLAQLSFDFSLPRETLLATSIELLCEYLGFPAGSINRVHGQVFEILALKTSRPQEYAIQFHPGARFPLAGSLMELLYRQDLVMTLAELEREQTIRHMIESYGVTALIGAAFRVAGSPYGVVTCLSYDPQFQGFGPHEREFMAYFCRWLGFMLERYGYVDRLQKLSNSKDRLLSMVAHDLRTPLATIVGSVQQLEQHKSAEADARMTALIFRACKQADALIRELLELAVLEQETDSLATEQWAWGTLIQETVQAFAERATAKGLQLLWRNDAPDALVALHPQKMTRVLENLLDNALKFTPTGGEICLQLRQRDQQAQLTVTDTGIGIPQNLQEVLFDEFSRARRPGLAGEPSTGLGMSIVKEIIRLHGGQIQVFSQEGQGTRFEIGLPLVMHVGPKSLL